MAVTATPECEAVLPGRLYVGNYEAARAIDVLNGIRCSHIVSAGFDDAAAIHEGLRYLCIDVRDQPTENLLRHMPKATQFIADALTNEKNVVFVHCVHGQSRSCAICVAYLIRCAMIRPQGPKEKSSLLHEMYNIVQKARPCMAINPGFMRQLEMYLRMICCDGSLHDEEDLDRSTGPPASKAHAAFRIFRSCSEYMDRGLVSDWYPSPPLNGGPEIYRCKRCRRPLFSSHNIVDCLSEDDMRALPSSAYWGESAGGLQYACQGAPAAKPTNKSVGDPMLNTELIQWMRPQMAMRGCEESALVRSGKLSCPNCSSKLGYWDLIGTDIYNAVYITPGKVEITNY